MVQNWIDDNVPNAPRIWKLDEGYKMHELSYVRHLAKLVVNKELTVNAYESDPYDALYYTYHGEIMGLELVGDYERRFEEIKNNSEKVIDIINILSGREKIHAI